jgi:hypothetical protein
MSQAFELPTGTDRMNVAIKNKIAGSLEALRTQHLGTSAPTSVVPGMLWLDTAASPPTLKMRDTSDTVWLVVMSLGSSNLVRLEAVALAGSLSATATAFAGSVPKACVVSRIVLIASNASTSSSGNEWTVQLKNYPYSTPGSPVDLISAACGTFTALGGVGGGAEHVADQALIYTPDQNLTMADLDVLEFVLTKTGTATTLTDFHAFVEIY